MLIRFRNKHKYEFAGYIYLGGNGDVVFEFEDEWNHCFFNEFKWRTKEGREVTITPENGVLFMKVVLAHYATYKTIKVIPEDRDMPWLQSCVKEEKKNEVTNGENVCNETSYVYA